MSGCPFHSSSDTPSTEPVSNAVGERIVQEEHAELDFDGRMSYGDYLQLGECIFRFLAGGKGPDGKGIPNITPTRLKAMSDADLLQYLQTGLNADGDVAAEPMSEVITNTLAKLTNPDIKALVAYLRSLVPLPEEK